MRKYPSIAMAVPEILLPADSVDLASWAVVACDQYTAQPEYWTQVEERVGTAPSTLRLIFPEVYLEEGDAASRIASIREQMQRYVDEGVLQPHDGLIYVERTVEGRTRRGLMLAVDLEAYEYEKGSTSLIRATEGTIVDRLPPRIKVRAGAPIELPHILVLIDDPQDTVMGPLQTASEELPLAYDVTLMQGGGHLRGYHVGAAQEEQVVRAIEGLVDPSRMSGRYALPAGDAGLLYAMGDGNHSLATAKAIWEQTKAEAADKAAIMDDPTRYALVELTNVHDPALLFEPIHRLIFEVNPEKSLLGALQSHLGDRLHIHPLAAAAEMVAWVDAGPAGVHRFGMVSADVDGGGVWGFEVQRPETNLAVGTLQRVLDDFMAAGGAREIDYVHGTDTVCELGARSGNVGFYVPSMDKNALFDTVIRDGALPRKAFSLGEAHEKRFYMECRRLTTMD